MVGSIDPRGETIRGTHWPVKVAGVFGTRVAENHLGQRSTNRSNRPDIWMQAIRSDPEKLLWHGGRPHMGPGARAKSAWPGRRQIFDRSPLNRQHVVVDLGDGVDAAQAHGHAEFVADDLNRPGDAGAAERAEAVNVSPA